MKINLPKLVISFVLVFVAAAVGSWVTFSAIATWYSTLQKPVFNPPNAIFGPVWTILYILMAISFYLVWVKNKKSTKKGITYFLVQLALNALWSIVFFGLHNPLLAFVVIIALWIFIFLTIVEFKKVDTRAAYLLVPYLLWVSFAGVLNAAIMVLN